MFHWWSLRPILVESYMLPDHRLPLAVMWRFLKAHTGELDSHEERVLNSPPWRNATRQREVDEGITSMFEHKIYALYGLMCSYCDEAKKEYVVIPCLESEIQICSEGEPLEVKPISEMAYRGRKAGASVREVE